MARHPHFVYCTAPGCTRPAREVGPVKYPCKDCNQELCEWCCDVKKQLALKREPNDQMQLPKMMPGQEPYSHNELSRAYSLIGDAAKAEETYEPEELERPDLKSSTRG